MQEGIMFLEKILPHGKKEREVTEDIRKHIKLLCTACGVFRNALEKQDRNLMRDVMDLEREGDSVRREVVSHIYEGAFLPYLRPDLCKFVELVDQVFGLLKDTAAYYLEGTLPDKLKNDSVRVALLNQRMCEMLLITFEAMLRGEDLREKILAIRIYEKKIDDIKFILISDAREVPIDNFWKGNVLAEFLSDLTSISDGIEDASDHLQIIHVAMR
jgi:predicted phosphate transport protein (TIGR00153 family)